MVASGALTLTVKVSIFFTLNVSEHVEYDFAGGRGKARSDSYSQSFE